MKEAPKSADAKEAKEPQSAGSGELPVSMGTAAGSKRTISVNPPHSSSSAEKDKVRRGDAAEEEEERGGKRPKLLDGSAGVGVTADSIAALAQEAGVDTDAAMGDEDTRRPDRIKARLGGQPLGVGTGSPRGAGGGGGGGAAKGLASAPSPKGVTSPRTDG
eukprot:2552087-Rhodomonas_salina.1